MGELIEPVAAGGRGRQRKTAGGTDLSIGDLRPKRARITQPGT